MRFTTFRLAVAALAYTLAAAPLHSQTPVKICPLGDSIVESFAGRASCRYYLDQMLRSGGYAFDFVGHNRGVWLGPPAFAGFDQDHEAYSGWKVEDVLAELDAWTRDTLPDIVLIHLGTNDMLGFQSVQSTVDELALCVDVIRGVNPFATVMISQIIPMRWRDVRFLNVLLPAMVQQKDTPQSRVVLVDHYSRMEMSTHLLPDGLHPNDAGERVMAETWFDALQEFLTPAVDELLIYGRGCRGANGSAAPYIDPLFSKAASPGNPYTVRFRDLPAGSLTYALLGFDIDTLYGVRLPYDLSKLGAQGCSLTIAPDRAYPIFNQAGLATWTIGVPYDPVLVGNRFYTQGLAIAPELNALGLLSSDAAGVIVVPGR